LVGFEGFIGKAPKASHIYLCDMQRGPSKTFKTYQRPRSKVGRIDITLVICLGGKS